jgi:hypothetical protein
MQKGDRIQMIKGGRFISHHDAAELYYDSRHKIIKTRMEGGGFFELVKVTQADGSYLDQMLFAVSPSGERVIIGLTAECFDLCEGRR